MMINKKMTALVALYARSSVNISLVAPVLAVAALVIGVLATLQVESVVRDGTLNMALAAKQKPRASIARSPVSATHYAEMAAVLARLNPAISIAPSAKGNSLIIAASQAELEPEWIYVLSTLQSHQAGVIWEADTICMRRCPNGQAAAAELRAYTQSVRM